MMSIFKYPEPIILAVALFLLALGSAWFAYSFPPLSAITGLTTMDPKGDLSKKLKATDIEANLQPLTSPVVWKEPANKRRLFDSDQYLFYPSAYPNGDYIKGMDPLTRTPSGVLLSWYQQYGLDFTDPNIDREDADGDGFSNITEFKNEQIGEHLEAKDCDGSKSSNPLDPQSHPPYLARLRLQKYESRPFSMTFNGYQQLNGEYLFQIHLDDVDSDKQLPLKKKGDLLGYEGYVIGEFHLNIVKKMNPTIKVMEEVDESTLDLYKPDIDFHVPLVLKQKTDSPESTADFIMLMPTEVDKVIKVPRGKILTVPYIPATDAQSLVLEVGDTGAKIRDTKTKKEYLIPKLDPAEWDEVPLPAGSAPKAP